jgi:hypothetical protein
MEGIIKLFKEVDGQTLFFAGVFVAVILGILVNGIVQILKNRKK